MSTSDDISRRLCLEDRGKLEYLQMYRAFRGYVLPMRGKAFDWEISKRQRGTTAWKNDPNSYCNHPPTLEEVEEWAVEERDIGAILGERSGIVALDIDCPELFMPLLADLPTFKTPVAKSPRGGYHLFFRHGLQVKNLSVPHPAKDSPCDCESRELASLRAEGSLVVLPPAQGREWLPGLSIREIEPAEVPPGLLELLARLFNNGEKDLPIGQGTPPTPSNRTTHVLLDTVLLEDTERYVLLEVDPSVLSLAKDKGSPLIPALVERLGGKGLRVPCPYHGPDHKASANFWFNNGWYLADHHFTPSHNLPVSQLCADLATDFLERCGNGSGNRYQHRVFTLRKDGRFKVEPQAFVWLALAAADLGLITLPPTRFPAKLDGVTPDGERVLRFIDNWDRARRYTCNSDVFPLARPFLISALFALPAPARPTPGEKNEPKTPEWLAAYNEVDKALYQAKRLGILEKVKPGVKGSKPALYRVCYQGGDLNEKGKSL